MKKNATTTTATEPEGLDDGTQNPEKGHAPASAEPTVKPPKTATITLTANGHTLTLRAHRLRMGDAETFVTQTDAGKKSERGMTIPHATFEIAKAHIAAQAAKAEQLGWIRKTQGRGFVAKPDAFSELPKVPKATPTPKVVKK